MKYIVSWLLFSIFYEGISFAQGTFQNFDFESAKIPDLPAQSPGELVSDADGIPGWMSNFDVDHTIGHNTVTVGGGGVIIYGPAWRDSDYILEGKYSVGINGAGLAIWQSGQVPETAKSLIFYGLNFAGPAAIQVSFAGNNLPVIPLQDRGRYIAYGADMSAFAGQTGELRFTATDLSRTILDDICFSTVAIPEPGSGTILLLGFCLFVAGQRCRAFRPEARDGAARHGKSA